jgi:hypothetical protein
MLEFEEGQGAEPSGVGAADAKSSQDRVLEESVVVASSRRQLIVE